MKLSPLDKAHKAAQTTDDASEEIQNEAEANYYDLFFNTVLFVPTWDIPEKPKAEELDDEMSIQPVIIEDESGEDNKTYIMLFDSEERLTKWADGKEVGIVGLEGHEVLNIFGSENYMLLNAGTEYTKEFLPEEIEWLLTSIVEEE